MQVNAEWAGTINAIHVAVGDAVQVDDELVTIESMKMLTPVLSTRAGTVSAVLVHEGQVIEEGAGLLTLE
jgi:acetyl-CoA carboxylase biotin carboxyl carrier protein